MSLDDFIDTGKTVSKTDEQSEKVGGTTEAPKKFSRDKFEEVLEETKHDFERKDYDWTKEWVYEAKSEDGGFIMRVYSSVDKRSNKARDTGSDAIRLVVLHADSTKPVLREKRTNRVPTWPKNLKKKIRNVEKRKDNLKFCNKCNGVMLIQKNKDSGDRFWGCSNYPDCRNTEPLG